jgi:hypothetical protein
VIRPKDSTGRPITVGDVVTWRGQPYTIKAFGDRTGRRNTHSIEFEEPLHFQDEVPDEIGVDLVSAAEARPVPTGVVRAEGSCSSTAPAWFTGHWRDWHRGHGCDRDDGKPRTEISQPELDVSVLSVRPHPDQASHNPGYWAVQFCVSRAGTTRTFWRWFYAGHRSESGSGVRPDAAPPTSDEILARFWDDTFAELHGFAFETTEST